MKVADLIYQETGEKAPEMYLQLGKRLRDNKNDLSHDAKEIVGAFYAKANKLNLANVSNTQEHIVQGQDNGRNLQMIDKNSDGQLAVF